ncbi:MAG TPA: Hsp20/alpha crystallin family protein [Candidatus Absconditabacterales bacterium]|nr:Hsp20/alpha crystallin family protein [Candidatus Absconditabacterales bacterium]
MESRINIPYDIYESPSEMVIIMPLGGVKKESVDISIDDYRLVIRGTRKKIELRDDCVPLKEECYRGDIEQKLDLPPQAYFDKIHSKLTSDNILQIIVPKSIVPEKIELEVERS